MCEDIGPGSGAVTASTAVTGTAIAPTRTARELPSTETVKEATTSIAVRQRGAELNPAATFRSRNCSAAA
jgi:hypothetical protein